MKLIKKNKKGFTLVELIVVIAILAILALILIPAISGYVSKAEKSRDQANARALYSAAMFELATDPSIAAATDPDEELEKAVALSTGIDAETFELVIGADDVSITVTFEKVTFDGKKFGEASK